MGLLVWLPLNGNLDNLGTSNVTVTNNGATVDNSGKIGKCYYFNGSSYIKISLPNTLTSIKNSSVCAWIKSTGSTVALGGISSDSDFTYAMMTLYTSGWQFGSGNSTDRYRYINGGSIANTSVWHHVCCTCDNTTVTTYLDGIKVNSNTLVNLKVNVFDLISSIHFLEIGCDHPGGNEFLTGYVNDFRVYDHCLSPKEVKEISKGLVLHYPLNDEYFKTLINYSTQGNTGGWNNSGNSTRNNNDINILSIPITSTNTVSITQTSDGQSAITFGTTSTNLPSKTLTASVWFWWIGNYNGNSITPYIRSSKTDGNVGNLTYNGNSDFRNWPKNTWIKLTLTFTSASDATTFYFCAYTSITNQKFAFNGWQIEEGEVATNFKSGTRNGTNKIYDCSGYLYDGTIVGTLNINNDTPRYNHSISVIETGEIKYPFPKLQELTYAFWFKRNRVSYSNREMLMTGWYGLSFELNTNNTLTFRHYLNTSGTFDVISTTTFTDTSKWYFITLTRNLSGVSKIYVNGVLDKSGTNTNTINYTASTAEIFTYSGSSYQFRGSISDFRIYSTVLSESDILELYNNPANIDNHGDMFSFEFNEEGVSKQQILKTGITKIDNFIEINDKIKILNDGSAFLQILHHNNPASNLFTSVNCWYYNDNNLYSSIILLKTIFSNLSEYEFLACEKLESSSTESQIRWKQTSNPALSTTASGYQLISGSSSYLSPGLVADTGHGCFDMSTGSWWCCCGCYVAYSGGIPGFTGVVKSGYLDLYIKIPEDVLKGNIGDYLKYFKKSILSTQIIEK